MLIIREFSLRFVSRLRLSTHYEHQVSLLYVIQLNGHYFHFHKLVQGGRFSYLVTTIAESCKGKESLYVASYHRMQDFIKFRATQKEVTRIEQSPNM